MELKFRRVRGGGWWLDGSNCTFMELKYKFPKSMREPLRRSNCTFMELKWEYAVIRAQQYLVLIVPLWN